jgi:hypothetical protein
MVSELSEGEILDYLMTSDFEEGLNPEEFKFLLFKFRNYYKKAVGNLSLEKDKIDSVIRNAEDSKRTIQNQIDEVLNQKKDMENKLNYIVNKKLTFKERFIGKIILDNENK